MNTNLNALLLQFRTLKRNHDEKKVELKKLADDWQECENNLIEAMVQEGVKSVDLDDIGKFTLVSISRMSVNAGNKERFFAYLKETGNDGILKLDVNPRTLSSFLAEHSEHLAAATVSDTVDTLDARKKTQEFLESQGVTVFVERQIRLTGQNKNPQDGVTANPLL